MLSYRANNDNVSFYLLFFHSKLSLFVIIGVNDGNESWRHKLTDCLFYLVFLFLEQYSTFKRS